MKIHGHPWSINTRKTLAVVAEKHATVELSLVVLPKGEHKLPAHIALHPFGKVPVLDDDGFILYETRAINSYLDKKLPGFSLVPDDPRAMARAHQWISIADSYLIPHAHPLLVELLFRRHLGGEQDRATIVAGRSAILPALDTADARLAESPYLAGESFSLADIHWLPYLDYLTEVGESAPIRERKHLSAWFQRVRDRRAWQEVAHRGPQPYDAA
ncbi:MAG: glutathione S-transferase C-terminal domain-containing protein [Myxococcales bacterium]|nr:glutathione S-transferase C-terminal domain-containing protein [Myxococcales bacterium]